MPQASEELRAKFPDMDTEALTVLDEHFTLSRDFIIRPKQDYHTYTERENDAIDYLCEEWDYGFERQPSVEVRG